MDIAIYARVSTSKDEQKTSLLRQVKELEEFCEKHKQILINRKKVEE